MSYTSLDNLKNHLGIAGTTEDVWLMELIAAATAAIDTYTGRRFAAVADTHRYGPEAVQGDMLSVRDDLQTVTELLNGDGAAIASDGYFLWPRRAFPHWGIKLKSGVSWTFADQDSEISVTGTWGYTVTPPADIAQICREYAARLYRSYDRQQDRKLSQADAAIPGDLAARLNLYRKRSL